MDGSDGLYFGPCLNPGGAPGPLALSDEARARIAEQIGQLLPDATADFDFPGPSDVAKAMEEVAKLRLKRQELHCHPRVTEHLRAISNAAPEPEFPLMTGSIGSLAGMPVIEHDDMEPGAWELREDGEIVGSGRLRTYEEVIAEQISELAPEGMRFEWK